jgi:hypothetical protein
VAKIVVPEGLLAQLRREIAEHGEAILVAAEGQEAYVVQPASGCVEPEDEEELGIVLDAVRDADEPWLSSKEARDRLRRDREQ